MLDLSIIDLCRVSITFDHRTLRTRLPVRSALFKQHTGGLVVRWMTTGESPLLNVFLLIFGAYVGPTHGLISITDLRSIHFYNASGILDVYIHAAVVEYWFCCRASFFAWRSHQLSLESLFFQDRVQTSDLILSE
jgi:hypothetical protein